MTNLTLFLARHGNTFESAQTPLYIGAKTDLPLTASGRLQAKKIAEYLKNKAAVPSAVYSGSLQRQKESAAIICDELRISSANLKVSNALQEIDYGAWEGLSAEQIKEKYPIEFHGWTSRGFWPEGIFGSSEEIYLSSLREWLQDVCRENNGNILIVTSNGTLRYLHILCSSGIRPANPEDIKVRTGGLCTVQYSAGNFNVVNWNEKP